MNVVAMNAPFGALVDGVDLARQTDAATLRRLIDALHEHQILAIRGQRLQPAEYVRFGQQWGKPLAFALRSHVDDDHPEINFQVLHTATPLDYSDAPGKRRLLYRISTKGVPALYAASNKRERHDV